MSVSLKFHCDSEDGTTIEVNAQYVRSVLYLEIKNQGKILNIDLNKSTAIKFSKELRKQIALLD